MGAWSVPIYNAQMQTLCNDYWTLTMIASFKYGWKLVFARIRNSFSKPVRPHNSLPNFIMVSHSHENIWRAKNISLCTWISKGGISKYAGSFLVVMCQWFQVRKKVLLTKSNFFCPAYVLKLAEISNWPFWDQNA